jgi:hypothetical protein
MAQERKIKGSVVLDMVKVIRAFKDLPWDQYLTPGDLELVRAMVIPTAWYPIEAYQRMGVAVFKLVAKGSEEAVRKFGSAAMKELFEGPYRPFLDKHDPVEAVSKFFELRKSLFNFSKATVEKTGPKSLHVRIAELGDFEVGLDVFLLLLDAHLTELIQYNGGKDVKVKGWPERSRGQVELYADVTWS